MAVISVPLLMTFESADFETGPIYRPDGESGPGMMFLHLEGPEVFSEVRVPIPRQFLADLLADNPGESSALQVAVQVTLDTDTSHHPLDAAEAPS